MGESRKFVFGASVKRQVAERIQAYVEAKFANNSAKAAESLKISRQRLFSYTSARAFPREPIFDLIFQEWGLDLLGREPRRGSALKRVVGSTHESAQLSLFDRPITLKSEELRVVIKRKGPRLVASIQISTDVEIA